MVKLNTLMSRTPVIAGKPAMMRQETEGKKRNGAAGGGILLGITLPETNSSHLQMDGWKSNFLLG